MGELPQLDGCGGVQRLQRLPIAHGRAVALHALGLSFLIFPSFSHPPRLAFKVGIYFK